MVCRYKMFVNLFPDIMNAPVLPVQEDDRRAVGLTVGVDMIQQAGHQGIAEQGDRPVVAGIAQHQCFVLSNGLVGKHRVIDLAVAVAAAGEDRKRFLGMSPAPSPKNLGSGIDAESQAAVALEHFDVQGPFPILPEICAEIGKCRIGVWSQHIDTRIVVEKIPRIGGEGDHRQRTVLINKIGMGHAASGQLPAVVYRCSHHRGGGDDDCSAVRRRIRCGKGAVQGVMNRIPGIGGKGQGYHPAVKPAGMGKLRLRCNPGNPAGGIGDARRRFGKVQPIVPAVRLAAQRNIHR